MAARLHLGCGLVHRPNWINVDRHAVDAPDLLADAILLPFADSSADVVEALQLVEHLGYVGTTYALHEWARVLTPGGTLRIETPDRGATLRAALCEETGPEAIPWLFGHEERGHTHRYLFSADELTLMAGKAGFTDVVAETDLSRPAHPTLRIVARLAPDTPQRRFTNRLHRALVVAGLIELSDTPQYLSALEGVCERASELIQTPSGEALLQLVSLSARYSPLVATCVLGALPEPAAWPQDVLARARNMVAELEEKQFSARLACRWRTMPKLPGTAAAAWVSLEREISLYLAACLCPDEGLGEVRSAFDARTAHPSPMEQSLDLFCRASLTDLARRLTAQGVRAFAREDLVLAAEMLEAALSHDPALLWPRWNIARLWVREGRHLDALEHYEALQAHLPAALRSRLEREVEALAGRGGRIDAYAIPLADISDLLTGAG